VSGRITALDTEIFGVDIQSGDIRGSSPAYALVMLGADAIERDVVSFRKLCRMISSRHPAIVATDNMYELAADKQELIRFLEALPAQTRLVQVTGGTRPEPLSRVAGRHGVPYEKRPMAEAEAAARLAAANVGAVVRAFTDTTRVKVARGRSIGKGGWSEDRYVRKIHGAVRRRTRAVAESLDAAGLEYHVDVTEKYGGYANAIFTVSASPADIPLAAGRQGDVRVEIARERRDGIEFEPLVTRRDPIIVGVDPGTTTAAAAVGLDGTLHATYSSRTDDAGALTRWIIDQGRPLIVAADVATMPETVEKLRRSFDAKGWTPRRDLPVDTKLHRVRDLPYENDHERDALSAAMFAVDAHREQIETVREAIPVGVDPAPVFARVIAKGEALPAVITALTAEEDDTETPDRPTQTPRPALQKENERLRARNGRLHERVDALQAQIEEQASTIDALEEEIAAERRADRRAVRERRSVRRLERDRDRLQETLADQRAETASLEEKLDRLKELWRLDHTDLAAIDSERAFVSVKVVEQFTHEGLDATAAAVGLVAGDVVYLRDGSGAGRSTAERLAEVAPRLVIRDGGALSTVADEVLFTASIPVCAAAAVPIQEVDDLAVARREDVTAAVDDWQADADARRREDRASMVDQIISEHRANGDVDP